MALVGIGAFFLALPTSALPGSRAPHQPFGRRAVLRTAALTSCSTLVPASASANDLIDGWEANRQANLARNAAAQEEKARLCKGRLAKDIPNLSYWDMTFDPPCYISGYYEVIVAAVIIGFLKVKTDAEPWPNERLENDALNDSESDVLGADE